MIGETVKPVELLKKSELLKAAGLKERAGMGGYKAPTKEQLAAADRKHQAKRSAADLVLERVIAKVEGVDVKSTAEIAKVLRAAFATIQAWKWRDIAERRKWPSKVFKPAVLASMQLAELLALAVEVLAEDATVLAAQFKIDVKALEKQELDRLKAAAKDAEAKKPAKRGKKLKKVGGGALA
jgi:hypothetical protein